MSVIRVVDSGWTGLEGLGESALRELLPRARRQVKRAALLFESEWKRTLTGPRHGRTYRVSRTGKLHVAAAPGEPPAVLTGVLRNSVGHTEPEVVGFTVSSVVGTSLGKGEPSSSYARRQEFGGMDSRGVYVPPHPHAQPTVERVEPRIEAMWRGSL